jgi:hypothetical protein
MKNKIIFLGKTKFLNLQFHIQDYKNENPIPAEVFEQTWMKFANQM